MKCPYPGRKIISHFYFCIEARTEEAKKIIEEGTLLSSKYSQFNKIAKGVFTEIFITERRLYKF